MEETISDIVILTILIGFSLFGVFGVYAISHTHLKRTLTIYITEGPVISNEGFIVEIHSMGGDHSYLIDVGMTDVSYTRADLPLTMDIYTYQNRTKVATIKIKKRGSLSVSLLSSRFGIRIEG